MVKLAEVIAVVSLFNWLRQTH